MSNPMPSVGRFVHYMSYGTPNGEYPATCRAAVITSVDSYRNLAGEDEQFVGRVDLCVINPTGLFFNQGVPYGEGEPRGGTWHWPERV